MHVRVIAVALAFCFASSALAQKKKVASDFTTDEKLAIVRCIYANAAKMKSEGGVVDPRGVLSSCEAQTKYALVEIAYGDSEPQVRVAAVPEKRATQGTKPSSPAKAAFLRKEVAILESMFGDAPARTAPREAPAIAAPPDDGLSPGITILRVKPNPAPE